MFIWQAEIEAGTKVLASQSSLDYRAKRSGWVGSTTLISSAFTALLNCAEVGRRNRILTNYRFLSHSLSPQQEHPMAVNKPTTSTATKSASRER